MNKLNKAYIELLLEKKGIKVRKYKVQDIYNKAMKLQKEVDSGVYKGIPHIYGWCIDKAFDIWYREQFTNKLDKILESDE
jgi:hypothetical protein